MSSCNRTNLWQNLSGEAREPFLRTVGRQRLSSRVGELQDVAQAYLYLMQEGFGTGSALVVDGGTVLV